MVVESALEVVSVDSSVVGRDCGSVDTGNSGVLKEATGGVGSVVDSAVVGSCEFGSVDNDDVLEIEADRANGVSSVLEIEADRGKGVSKDGGESSLPKSWRMASVLSMLSHRCRVSLPSVWEFFGVLLVLLLPPVGEFFVPLLPSLVALICSMLQ